MGITHLPALSPPTAGSRGCAEGAVLPGPSEAHSPAYFPWMLSRRSEIISWMNEPQRKSPSEFH